MHRERIKGHLDLLLLSVLAAGPAHGYAIISALRERSEGTFDLPEGTIYPALHRLEDAELLSARGPPERRRRVYVLTSAGATALAAEQTERRRFSTAPEAAISSFGSVRAVVRAHARRVPPVTVLGELVMAAWKLGSIALLAVAASGVVALAMNELLGRQFVGGNPAAAVAIPSAACRYWMSIWPPTADPS